jgi:hypothetical protein
MWNDLMDEVCYRPGGMRYECRSFAKIIEEYKPLDWCKHGRRIMLQTDLRVH